MFTVRGLFACLGIGLLYCNKLIKIIEVLADALLLMGSSRFGKGIILGEHFV